ISAVHGAGHLAERELRSLGLRLRAGGAPVRGPRAGERGARREGRTGREGRAGRGGRALPGGAALQGVRGLPATDPGAPRPLAAGAPRRGGDAGRRRRLRGRPTAAVLGTWRLSARRRRLAALVGVAAEALDDDRERAAADPGAVQGGRRQRPIVAALRAAL